MAVPRGAWDDSAGLVALTKYANAEARAVLEAGMLQSSANCYLAYAAAGALLKWVWAHCMASAGEQENCRPANSLPPERAATPSPMPLPAPACRYLEQDAVGLVPLAGSLAVWHADSDTHMHIDQATAAALELIHPIRVGTCSAKLSGMSLLRWEQQLLAAQHPARVLPAVKQL